MRYMIDCLRLSNDSARLELGTYKEKVQELTAALAVANLPDPVEN